MAWPESLLVVCLACMVCVCLGDDANTPPPDAPTPPTCEPGYRPVWVKGFFSNGWVCKDIPTTTVAVTVVSSEMTSPDVIVEENTEPEITTTTTPDEEVVSTIKPEMTSLSTTSDDEDFEIEGSGSEPPSSESPSVPTTKSTKRPRPTTKPTTAAPSTTTVRPAEPDVTTPADKVVPTTSAPQPDTTSPTSATEDEVVQTTEEPQPTTSPTTSSTTSSTTSRGADRQPFPDTDRSRHHGGRGFRCDAYAPLSGRQEGCPPISDLRQWYNQCTNESMVSESYRNSSGACTSLYHHANTFRQSAEQVYNMLIHGCSDKLCCHNPVPDLVATVRTMTTNNHDLRQLLENQCQYCPVDCAWSEWSAWSQCPPCQEYATSQRTRVKIREARYGGVECSGRATMIKHCSPPQFVYGQWSSWSQKSSCSATCGGGVTTWKRTCNYGSIPADHFVCKKECTGEDSKYETCNLGACCKNRILSEWSSWGDCNHNQKSIRTRECTNDPRFPYEPMCPTDCIGAREESRKCCKDDIYSDWDRWGQCQPLTSSVNPDGSPCGRGQRSRDRRCESERCGGQCYGKTRDVVDCQLQDCCENRVLSQWSGWSECTHDLARVRTRECIQDPKFPRQPMCPSDCTGHRTDTDKCCKDDIYGKWGDWSECSALTSPQYDPDGQECGKGKRSRSRKCLSQHCGGQCYDGDVQKESIHCHIRDCCVPRVWSTWSEWSACSTSVGSGVRSRSRVCTAPRPLPRAPLCRGECRGQATEKERCDGKCDEDPPVPCPEEWENWPTCKSTDCGGIVEMTRRRVCRRDYRTGYKCVCLPEEVQKKVVDCRGELQQWGSWSNCPECGGRDVKRTRGRRCHNNGVCGCHGDLTQTKYEDCPGPEWSVWTTPPCPSNPVQCYYTFKETRWCQNGNHRCPCVGTSSRDVQKKCDGGCHCTDWSDWGECSASCANGNQTGQGRQVRTRQCRSSCGNKCSRPVDEIQYKYCQAPCYEYRAGDSCCKCKCSTGEKETTSLCYDRSTGGIVPLINCQHLGPANKVTGYCDVRTDDICREGLCITSCRGKVDGSYPSCTSCRDYIQCHNGLGQEFRCGYGTVFDVFKNRKCVDYKRRISCSLEDPVTDCTGKEDGLYPHQDSCQQYIECINERIYEKRCPRGWEYNHHGRPSNRSSYHGNGWHNNHQGRCEKDRSPTCQRNYKDNSIITTIQRDATADMYVSDDGNTTDEDAQERFAKSMRRFNPSDVCLRTEVGSAVCKGRAAGHYASCRGCGIEIVCHSDGTLTEQWCPDSGEFDVSLGRCVKESSSCYSRTVPAN